MSGPRTSRRNGQSGEALIEFALVLPLLLILTFLVIDFGRAFFVQNVMDQCAREAARALAVGANEDSIRVHVGALAASAVPTPQTYAVDLNNDYGAGGQVRGEVTTTLKWLTPGILKLLNPTQADSVVLKGTCVMRREYPLP